MALFSKIRLPVQDAPTGEKLSRFASKHVREHPTAVRDSGRESYDRLTRTMQSLKKETTAPSERKNLSEPVARKTLSDVITSKPANTEGDLYATDNISIDVLRRALPLRSSMLLS